MCQLELQAGQDSSTQCNGVLTMDRAADGARRDGAGGCVCVCFHVSVCVHVCVSVCVHVCMYMC
jgi:hypothetical protein